MVNDEQQDIFGDDTHGNDLSKADVANIDDHRWPKAMAEMIEVLAAAAQRHGLATDQGGAKEMARWVVMTLGQYFGGRQVYLPKGDILRAAIRDNQIWQEFTGHNHEALGIKYGVSTVWVYKIIEQQRAIHLARVQPQLPFERGANDH